MTTILLTPIDVATAASLLVLDAGLSLWLNVGVHRQLFVAAARMVVQLIAIGYLLKLIFAMNSPAATLLLVTVMVVIAAREVAARPERRFAGGFNIAIGIGAVGSSTLITVVLALTTAIRPQPWFEPHYAIPLAGIILGSVLNSASISLDSILTSVRRSARGSRPGCRWAAHTARRWRRWSASRFAAGCCRSSTRCRPPASSPCRAS